MNNQEMINKIKSVKSRIEKLIEDGRLNEAKAALDKLERNMPGDLDICSMRAVIHIMEGRLEEAEANLMQGLEKDTVQFDLLFNLAYLRELSGQYQQAADLYCKASTVVIDPAQRMNVSEALKRIKLSDDSIVISDKARIVFFVKDGMNDFFEDIIACLSDKYWIRRMAISDLEQINVGMEWADICWFEWCDELIIYGSKLPSAKSKKIICRLHRYEVFTDKPGKVVWENVDKLILVTGHIKSLLEMNHPGIVDRVDTLVIENGVDVERYQFRRRECGFNIAMVGYIHSRKNPVMILQIIQKLVRHDKRYKLYVAGQFQDQLLRLYWEYQINRMGLSDNVIFDGWQNDISKWLEDKNYLLSTSIHESFGYGIAEAMARGIKPVIHDFLHANDIWDEQFLFTNVDEAVNKIVNGSYESEIYRSYIEENYSLKKQLQKTEELIIELLEFRNIMQKVQGLILGHEEPDNVKLDDVTVLIPCYNRAKMLAEDLKRGLKLGSTPKLIVDDHSYEETEWLEYLTKHPELNTDVLVRDQNRGVADTRLFGLKSIRTKHTAFIDDDNMMFCLDKNVMYSELAMLEDDVSIIVPRYILNLYKEKLSVGYDRKCFDGLNGEQTLKILAQSGEMMMLLTGGAFGATNWMAEYANSPLFTVSEDYVMLARMMASEPRKKIIISESIVFVRRFLDEGLTLKRNTAKMVLWLVSQAIACYYCLFHNVADKDEVLRWMKDRAALIQKLYGFGESFEAELIGYFTGVVSEEALMSSIKSYGINVMTGLSELAPELKEMRNLIYESNNDYSRLEKECNKKQYSIVADNKKIDAFNTKCNDLYKVNYIESLNKATKLFSVVVPARNSAKYLEYTLKTCLDQNFNDYEIVVSDNSSPGNNKIHNLVKELGSDKIRYIRPTRELSLTKSFEYAYLNSQGEYIIGLGSDDALMLHALESLNNIVARFQDEELFLWDKLFYCWPGVVDRSQENLFFVNKMYHKNKINVSHLNCKSLLDQVLRFDINMYMMPMGYINSAIHRKGIKRIIEKTGSFLEGWSQDVYTGLINLALHEDLLYISYPMTIAGLSPRSLGFSSNHSKNEADREIINEHHSMSDMFNEYYQTRFIPKSVQDFDRALLLIEFFKIIDRGIVNWNYDMVDWKRFFALCAEHIKEDESRFEFRMEDICRTIAEHHTKDLLGWFSENFYDNRGYRESKQRELNYQKGFFSDHNALRIDMSKFGVDNIYDVAKFFSNLYNI